MIQVYANMLFLSLNFRLCFLFLYIRPFSCFFCFPNIIMNTLNVVTTIKKMTVNELREFIFENYYKQIGFVKEESYYSIKRLKNKDLLLFATKLIKK